jgi:hypothetical protein
LLPDFRTREADEAPAVDGAGPGQHLLQQLWRLRLRFRAHGTITRETVNTNFHYSITQGCKVREIPDVLFSNSANFKYFPLKMIIISLLFKMLQDCQCEDKLI